MELIWTNSDGTLLTHERDAQVEHVVAAAVWCAKYTQYRIELLWN
jgi:hypothetical protein